MQDLQSCDDVKILNQIGIVPTKGEIGRLMMLVRVLVPFGNRVYALAKGQKIQYEYES
jgi:hypothetical protein